MGEVRWPGERALAADLLLAGALVLFAAGSAHWWSSYQFPDRRHLDALGFGLMTLACLGVAGRRVWPPGAAAVTAIATALYLAGNYPYGPFLLASVVAVYSLATRLSALTSLAASGVVLALYLAADALSGGLAKAMADGLVWSTALAVTWTVGAMVRMRRESVGRQRQEEERRRAYEQRLEIAREVHDVVGHGLAVINMQAGVALHVLKRRPEQSQIALEAIQQASKEALEELRRTLGVFRNSEDGEVPRRPEPGLDQLEVLLAAIEAGGLRVALERTGQPRPVPAAIDLAGYRIVQESLTNALRHAGPTTATVRVTYAARDLELEILNGGRVRWDGSAPRGGHGIAGMRERVAAVGGELEVGPGPAGGFRVLARLPLDRNGR
jgi:signal transduction histidine kinase